MSRAFRVGAFILATLLIFASGVFLIGNKQYLFSSTYRLNAQFPNVAGLADGAEVRVGGLRKGTVKRIVLPSRSDGKVSVVMDLHKSTRDVVKKDSVASIAAEGLVGDKYVEISFGTNGAEKVKDGDTIVSRPPLEMAEVVKKANEVLESAKGAVDNLDATAGNFKSISSKIDQGRGSVGALVNDKAMYQHVNEGAAAFQENMEALKHNFLVRGFFKKRGYEDSTDLTRHEIAQLPPGPPSKSFAYDATKVFDKPDSAKLKNQKLLTEAGKFLEQGNFGLTVVAAYTGMKGDSEKNKVLTEARAMVVRDYLVENFKLNDTRIKTIGVGKTSESDDHGKIEIIVYPAGTNLARASRRAK
jgi:phospholipid/cholesterol/gamma-HCH transport system substrate-binding protein